MLEVFDAFPGIKLLQSDHGYKQLHFHLSTTYLKTRSHLHASPADA